MAGNSKKLSSNFLIGLFVVLGAFLFVGVVMWLSANKFLKEQIYYVTYFEGSVEGLNVGSPVKYQGVPCGAVKALEVAPDGKLIEVVLQVDDKIAINNKLRVKAEMAGIAGGKFLQLYYPTDPVMSEMYPKLSFEPPYKLIKSSPSGMDEIALAARDVMTNLMQLKVGEISDGTVGFLGATTKFFNNKELYDMIANLQKSSASLASLMGRADTSNVISNLAATSGRLNQTSEELLKFVDNLNGELKAMQLPTYIDKIYTRYDQTMNNTNKSISSITYRMENMIFGLNETFDELRQTNRQLQKSLRELSTNPGQLLLTEPAPKEK